MHGSPTGCKGVPHPYLTAPGSAHAMLNVPQLAIPHFLRAACRRAAQSHFPSSATSIRRIKVRAAHNHPCLCVSCPERPS
eukprot:scaffold44132_cov219-Isochrysis_galbana.AAC.3